MIGGLQIAGAGVSGTPALPGFPMPYQNFATNAEGKL